MNFLTVGKYDTETFLEHLDLSEPFLLIDDGPLIEELTPRLLEQSTLPNRPPVQRFDLSHDKLNPLLNADYLKQQELVAIFQSLFPVGANTLTKEGAWDELAKAFETSRRFDRMFKVTRDDPGYTSAQRMVRRLLRSPILKPILCSTTTIPQNATVLVKVSQSELGPFDAPALTSLFIAEYKHQVVVTNFGAYGRDHHAQLIYEDRLIAGVHFLDDLSPSLRRAVLSIEDKQAHQCCYDDAVELAKYTFHIPNTDGYDTFIKQACGLFD